VVEGPVFQHDNEYMLDSIWLFSVGGKQPARQPGKECSEVPEGADDIGKQYACQFGDGVPR